MTDTSRQVTVRAPAKINLHLGVGAPRDDGFHPLVTVYQAVGLYDDVTVTEADDWSVTTSGTSPWVDLGGVPDSADNIAVRAGRALAAHHGVDRRARVSIAKGIPVAGGMAGGSADAAAALLALDRLWGLGTTDDDLLALAAGLGSDVPFALVGGTALGTGRGEQVTAVDDAGGWWWVCLFSAEGLSTPSVYAAYDLLTPDPTEPAPPEALLATLRSGDHDLLARSLHNDLQAPAVSLRDDLRRTLDDAGADAATALLSGSGPTVLALCSGAEEARRLAGALAEKGYDRLAVVPGPVAGAHVISYPDPDPEDR